ncbi:MAG: 50S ribosomal protein L13 [Nanoarchaeota archaeon]|nr:50S ribosomal protein L13 [Nanoarchaeota archaeon]
MIVIDGKNATMGRLASYAAKQALNGEEIAILNAELVIITGNKEFIRKEFLIKRGRVGSGQRGPTASKNPEKYLKRVIRGMLPNYRWGRGKSALGRIKCYKGIPKAFESVKKISAGKDKSAKFMQLKEILK